MTTNSRTQPSHAPPAARRIADVVYRSLKTAVKQQSVRRYDEDVTLRRHDRTSAGQLMQLRLECRDLVQVNVSVTTTHVGGNVYDVRCEIEDGPSRRVTSALPAGAGTGLSRAPGLGQKLGDFLLNEIERHLGRRVIATPEPTAAR
jgi:hypothetical protein